MLESDCSPNVSDLLGNGGLENYGYLNARIIAKKKIGQASDQNEYRILCLRINENDTSVRHIEYVIWTLTANESNYVVTSGHYLTDLEKAVKLYQNYSFV